jgi:hypothetical protein
MKKYTKKMARENRESAGIEPVQEAGDQYKRKKVLVCL